MRRLVVAFLLAASLPAQDTVSIRVNASSKLGPFQPIYRFYGYDEPNFTYAEHGKKLLSALAALGPAPVYIRAHNLLTTGDGAPALKWGSTNAYTENASGAPIYDWTILDRIFDTYQQAKVRPLVEIGFMPEALSSKPEPYRHHWPDGLLWTGWAYPPRDYQKWAGLVYQWVRHEVDRYGRQSVESWYWEVWNEPNIGYWQGSPGEYQKLFDFTADAVKRALPTARIGGPHSTGPASPQAADFLRRFLDHVVRGTNFATGKTGSPLDYIGFHAKGAPTLIDGRVQMGISKQLRDISNGFAIAASYPELRGRPIIIGESDPEGCAACSARLHPQNAYRNTAL
jgi:xylan 1,4-beta-xylosidase